MSSMRSSHAASVIPRVVAVALLIAASRPSSALALMASAAALLAAAIPAPFCRPRGRRAHGPSMLAHPSDMPAARDEFERSYALLRVGAYAAAADGFRGVLRGAPNDPDAHYYFGVALSELGRHAEAVRPLREAVRLRPLHAEAHHRLGVALLQLDERFAAGLCLREAARLNPRLVGREAAGGRREAMGA
jgi:Flp pilus assembly protein TadD